MIVHFFTMAPPGFDYALLGNASSTAPGAVTLTGTLFGGQAASACSGACVTQASAERAGSTCLARASAGACVVAATDKFATLFVHFAFDTSSDGWSTIAAQWLTAAPMYARCGALPATAPPPPPPSLLPPLLSRITSLKMSVFLGPPPNLGPEENTATKD